MSKIMAGYWWSSRTTPPTYVEETMASREEALLALLATIHSASRATSHFLTSCPRIIEDGVAFEVEFIDRSSARIRRVGDLDAAEIVTF